jgi:drug/metabolite transporter (DMT)-like permease
MITINWVILSILTGIFFGLQIVFIKILSKSLHSFQILQYLFLIAGALLLPFLFFIEFRIDLSNFLTALFISFVINVVSFYLLAKAIEISPVSLVMPFVGLTPLFLTISGSIILNESITFIKFAGIIFIVIGGFVLQIPENIKNKKDNFFHRFINIKEKGIRYVIIVAFLWSISASVEKIAVKASSPEIYGAAIH